MLEILQGGTSVRELTPYSGHVPTMIVNSMEMEYKYDTHFVGTRNEIPLAPEKAYKFDSGVVRPMKVMVCIKIMTGEHNY